MKNKNPLRIFWILLGFICLGLGAVGIVLPILPTVPFFMAIGCSALRKAQSGSTTGSLERIFIKSIWTAL